MTRAFKKIIHIARWVALLTAGTVIFLIAISYPVFSYIERDHALIEQRVSEKINMPFHFKKIQAGWQKLKPGIKLEQVVIDPKGQPFFSAEAIYVQLDFIESLRTRSWVLGTVTVVGTHIPIRELANNQFEILGFRVQNPPMPAQASEDDLNETLHNFLTQSISLSLRKSQIEFTRNTGKVFNIDVRRLSLQGGGEHHSLDMVATWNEHNTAVRMSADLKGLLWEPDKLLITGKMNVEDLPWDVSFPRVEWLGLSPEKGEIDLKAEYKWNAGILESLRATSHIRNMKLTTSHKTVLEPVNFSGEMTWRQDTNDTWSLSGRNVRLQIEHYDEVLAGTFEVRHTEGNVIEAQADTLPLDDIGRLLSYTDLLPEAPQKWLTTLQPQGVLRKVHVRWQDEKDWNAETEFLISHQAYGDIPAVTNMQGTLSADPEEADITIDSNALVVDFQGKFSQPLTFTKARGEMSWGATPNGWELRAHDLVLENGKVKMGGEFILSAQQSHPLNLNLYAETVGSISATNIKQYLPVGFLSPPLATWLQTAVGDTGAITQANMTIQGPLNDFPMFDKNPTGIFELNIDVKDLTLQYLPDWPAATDLKAQMAMRKREIDFVVDNTSLQGIAAKNVKAHLALPQTDTPRLTVSGQAQTTAQKGYDFLKASALWETLSPALGGFTIKGPIDLGIALDIPLGDSKRPLSVFGTVDMHNGLVHMNDWNIDFSKVNGVLQFTEKTPMSTGITGILFDKPATLSITPPAPGKTGGTQWRLNSIVAVDLLQQHFPSDAWKFVSGNTPIDAVWLTGGNNTKAGLEINVTSDLKGISLQFPPPFVKAADEVQPFQYTLTLGNNQQKMHIVYGSLLDATLGFKEKNDKTVLQEGDVKIGHLKGAKVKSAPIRISVAEWQEFFKKLSPKKAGTEAQKPADSIVKGFQKVSIYADELKYETHTLLNSQYILSQSPDNWLFEIQSNEWRGRATIPKDNKSTVDLKFAHCNWQPDASQKNSSQYNIKPQDIRAFNFVCDNFIYAGRNLGRVAAAAEPKTDRLDINNLSVSNSGDVLKVAGVWQQENKNAMRTSFKGSVESRKIDRTLHTLGISSGVKDSTAHIGFDLSWPNAPYAVNPATLDGHVEIALGKGYIVGVEPGFGRVLGLLNVQNIQRRLQLDFSDVFKDGYSFDKIEGEVKIRRGLAYFEHIQIDSPSSVVVIQGGTNLGDKTLDLVLTVSAQLSAGLPLTATLAAVNPIVGAISAGIWAAGKVMNAQFGNLVNYHYHVTGTWDKPKLTELSNKAEAGQVLQNIQARYGS